MFLVHEEAGNGPRAGVEVLVGAPGSHINSPVMEVELNVASCMGQIKTNIATLGQKKEGGGEKENERERGTCSQTTVKFTQNFNGDENEYHGCACFTNNYNTCTCRIQYS